MLFEGLPTRYGILSQNRKKNVILSKKIMKKVLKFDYFYSKITMKVPQSGFKWNEVVEVVENLVENQVVFKVFHRSDKKFCRRRCAECCQVNIAII